ncbi:MAG: MBL fold metallo-hydrolase [Idiomarina sp.]
MTATSAPLVKAFLDGDSETYSYVVYDEPAGHAVVIDPVLDFDYKSGRTATEGAQKIIDFIQEQNLKLAWVLETHAHADHLSAAPFISEQLGAPIGIGEHIKNVQEIFRQVFNLEKEFLPNGNQFNRLFADGETFQVGKLSFRVMHTPGHTPADLAYLVNDSAVFVGDTLFMPDVGTARCDFPGGSSAQLFQSIQKLLALPPATAMYICHDYPPEGREHSCKTTVAAQKANNLHVHEGVSESDFVQMRDERDSGLDMPRLILPAIQVNIRAGQLPPAEGNGQIYLKLPLNQL